MNVIKMRFADKLFTDMFFIVLDYSSIYKVYYAINQDGELLIIGSVQYRGAEDIFLIEIIGVKE